MATYTSLEANKTISIMATCPARTKFISLSPWIANFNIELFQNRGNGHIEMGCHYYEEEKEGLKLCE
eukprot:m.129412 g.129412  ORF g.129412 m.129412 type:complete len:67 (+) comp9460_c0_seq10:4249-4449(+)